MPYIYVMDRDGGHMKVGFSCDPHKRLPQVYGARSVLAMWQHDQAFQIEQADHRLLADWRQDGEWFAIDRYEAFDAVSRAMRAHDSMTPVQRIVDLTGDYDVPPVPANLGSERHRLGYLRPTADAPGGQQMKWLLSAGVDEVDVYVEGDEPAVQLDAAMKDCRDNDLFFAWSTSVFGDRAADTTSLIRARGADLVTAI